MSGADASGPRIHGAFVSVLGLVVLVFGLALASRAEAYVYWTVTSGLDTENIARANLDGSGVDTDFFQASCCEAPFGIALDNSYIYWANRDFPQINRVDLDGSNRVELIALHDLPSQPEPDGVAVDDTYVYWQSGDAIGRANVDGSSPDPAFIAERCTYLIEGEEVTQACDPELGQEIAYFPPPQPRDIAVDAGHIYWTHGASAIGRSDLGGSNVDTSFITGTSNARGIAIDGSHIYWANTGSNAIGRADLDGSNINQSFIAGATSPSDLAIDANYIYWATGTSGEIGRAELDSSNVENAFITTPYNAVDIAVDALGSADPPAPSPGTTDRVNVSSSGGQANFGGGDPALSADGRYVAFSSLASNLANPDGPDEDVFVRDRHAGSTQLISVDSAGNAQDGISFGPAITPDGRFVGFVSDSSDIVAGDTNGVIDIFMRDRETGTTERVSVDSAGNEANGGGPAGRPALSADGRFVAFLHGATNLVPDDTNNAPDVFVHDRQTGTTERVSVDSAGDEGSGQSGLPAISSDGRLVAFSSTSSLAPGGGGGVFVHDRQTGTTERVSVDSAGNDANNMSSSPAISPDGRYVTFESSASNLVPGDNNGKTDIFLHDRQTGTTERVSVDSAGNEANGDSGFRSSISADGRLVAFDSAATNLVPGDTNGSRDVFVHDRLAGTTQRVSVDSAGTQGNGLSDRPSLSTDGRFVGFQGPASNLVAGDTNDAYDIFVHELANNSVSEDASAGGTVSTNSITSPGDPTGSSVTTPAAGTVTIVERPTTTPGPSGYSLLGQEVQITAPTASTGDPLVLRFLLDASLLPPGADESSVQVFRNGAALADCDPGSGSSAMPDPCVASRAATGGGGIEFTVRTSQASTWNFGVAIPPQTTITSGPSGATNDPTPTLAFSSSLAGSSFECKLDAGSYAPCSSPKTAAHLVDGSHTFYVRATKNGVTDPTPAVRNFTVRTAEVKISGSTLVVTAAAGAEDNLVITKPSASTLRVTDVPSGAYAGSGVHTGAGCTRSGDYTANCSASGITLIQVIAADQTDKVTNSTAVKSSLNGGAADDVLTGGSANDTLIGATGADVFRGMNGNDDLRARDLTSDTTINCDGGSTPGAADKADLDLLPRDPNSAIAGCETKTRH